MHRQSNRPAPAPARPRAAFTLIELLVVISIIALLVGILLPALSAARDAANTTKSLAHAQQISLALHNYAVDHKQLLPGTEHGGASWMDRIAGYIDDPRAFRSPRDRSTLWDDVPPGRETSYALNAYFSPDHPPYFGVNLDQVGSPAATIVIAEIDDDFEEDHFTPMFWGFDHTAGGSQNLAYANGVDVTAVPVPLAADGRIDDSDGVDPAPQDGQVDYEHDAEENWDPERRIPANMAVRLDIYDGKNVWGFADGHAALRPFEETFVWDAAEQAAGNRPSVDWFDPRTRNK